MNNDNSGMWLSLNDRAQHLYVSNTGPFLNIDSNGASIVSLCLRWEDDREALADICSRAPSHTEPEIGVYTEECNFKMTGIGGGQNNLTIESGMFRVVLTANRESFVALAAWLLAQDFSEPKEVRPVYSFINPDFQA